MIYSKFIEKIGKYLHSVRILKNYVSFDLTLPTTWMLLKNYPETIEVIQNEGKEGVMITSFVTINDKEKIDKIETIIEKENLENLKGLKFDIEELHKFMSNGHQEINNGGTTTIKKA
jgi:nitrogen regulatory protein PII-like uncharacterized protein